MLAGKYVLAIKYCVSEYMCGEGHHTIMAQTNPESQLKKPRLAAPYCCLRTATVLTHTAHPPIYPTAASKAFYKW